MILYVILGLASGYVFLSGSVKHPLQAKPFKENGSAYEAITGESADDERPAWDHFYKEKSYIYGKDPVSFLKEMIEQIPTGKAFVPAMGEGRNAVFLAKRGFQVLGNDLSEVAVDKARAEAKLQQVTLKTTIADLKTYHYPENEYDFILVSQFYDKSLNHFFKRALKKGGYIMFYNHAAQPDHNHKKMSPDDFVVNPHELKEQYKDFHMIKFKEYMDGDHPVVGMLARKP